ncbi:hypothetical protein JOL62DRAFT_603321, partial [Phyllosticta paracitricarpa]
WPVAAIPFRPCTASLSLSISTTSNNNNNNNNNKHQPSSCPVGSVSFSLSLSPSSPRHAPPHTTTTTTTTPVVPTLAYRVPSARSPARPPSSRRELGPLRRSVQPRLISATVVVVRGAWFVVLSLALFGVCRWVVCAAGRADRRYWRDGFHRSICE